MRFVCLFVLAVCSCGADVEGDEVVDHGCLHDGEPCKGGYPHQIGTCREKEWALTCCFGCWTGYTCEPGITGMCGANGEECSPSKCA